LNNFKKQSFLGEDRTKVGAKVCSVIAANRAYRFVYVFGRLNQWYLTSVAPINLVRGLRFSWIPAEFAYIFNRFAAAVLAPQVKPLLPTKISFYYNKSTYKSRTKEEFLSLVCDNVLP
jgi:hypothetical protein